MLVGHEKFELRRPLDQHLHETKRGNSKKEKTNKGSVREVEKLQTTKTTKSKQNKKGIRKFYHPKHEAIS